MRIKRMSATFGTLDKAELTLLPGLNVITAPNESGKSTWTAFLLAMLYGVDSAERTTKTNLPAKVKYKPWSGQAMQGRLELEANGQNITIERSSQGRAVLGSFRAYDTDTGRDLDWLREDTCGQQLLGVPRGVFERSGYIRQQGLAVTADPALESRLTALVTTGDETVSFTQTEKRLRDLRNRRRHNKTGLLPQAEQALDGVKDALNAISELGRRNMRSQARQDELTAEQESLRRQLAQLQAADQAQKREQLAQSRADWEKKAHCLSEKEQTVANLPEPDTLQDLLRKLDAMLEAEAALDEDLRLGVTIPEEPERPAVFAGLSPDEIRQTCEDDCRRLAELADAPKAGPLFWILAAALAAGGVAFLFVNALVGCGLLAGGALLAIVALTRQLARKKHLSANEKSRAALLGPYGAADEESLRRAANDCREAALLHKQNLLVAQQQQARLDQRAQDLRQRSDALLEMIRAFAPDAQDLTAARQAAQQAVHRRQFHAAAAREEAQSRAQYEAVRAAVGPLDTASGAPVGEVDPTLDAAKLSDRLEAVSQELLLVRSQLDQQRGRMLALGDPAALEARKEELSERIARLQMEYDALELAITALEQANDALQTRFAPQLSALAAAHMAVLTQGRYDKVLLDRDMAIDARRSGDAVSHPLLALSAGTADQLYLAVRLSIAELALNADTPLLLDDALAFFDDTRMAAALDLLEQQAETRQVILFTCQNREQAYQDTKRASR